MRVLLLAIGFLFASSAYPQQASSNTDDAIKRIEADIERRLEESKNWPRMAYAFTKDTFWPINDYASACLRKIEEIGNRNFPEEAKNTFYGKVVASFEVISTGEVRNVRINKSSGYAVLDNAIQRAIELASPLPPFSQEVKKRADVVFIARTFTFEKRNVASTAPGVSEP